MLAVLKMSSDDTDEDKGPIIRTPRIPKGANYENYEDSIMRIDCGPFWRKFGLHRWVSCRNAWFVKDICGVICCIFTWLLIGYSEFVVYFVMLGPFEYSFHSVFNGIIFQCGAILAVISHAKAMLSDPVSIFFNILADYLQSLKQCTILFS